MVGWRVLPGPELHTPLADLPRDDGNLGSSPASCRHPSHQPRAPLETYPRARRARTDRSASRAGRSRIQQWLIPSPLPWGWSQPGHLMPPTGASMGASANGSWKTIHRLLRKRPYGPPNPADDPMSGMPSPRVAHRTMRDANRSAVRRSLPRSGVLSHWQAFEEKSVAL